MMKAVKQVHIKPSNLEQIQNNTIDGSKFFAYLRLLEKKGGELTGSKRLKGAKLIYIGGVDYIGAKVTRYPNGSFKLHQITATINAE